MELIDHSFKILTPANKKEGRSQLRLMELAARTCYNSRNKITECSYEKLIHSLIRREHETPLEFGQMTVELITSRDVMAELTRHRHATFNIESQRYVNYESIHFVKPLRGFTNEEIELLEKIEEFYKSSNLPPEEKRKLLPNCTATKIVMTANIREWLHIFRLRTSEAAYPEMRKLMRDLKEEAHILFPIIF